MLSIYASNGSVVEETNVRKIFDVMVKKSKSAIKSAAIVYDNGNIAAKTSNFKMRQRSLLEVRRAFSNPNLEKLSYCDVTFCIKSKTPNQIVAFNGAKYVIISKTEVAFIIVTCANKQKHGSLATWIETIAETLRDRHT